MNIAIFTPGKNPYSETFIQAHKNYLQGRIFYYYGNKNKIQLEGKKAIISNFENNLLRLAKWLFGKPASWIYETRVKKSISKNRIDVILVEYGAHAHQLLPILRTLNVPFVVHFHGYDASVTAVIERCDDYQHVFKHASKVIVVSKTMEEKLLQLGCPSEKLQYNVYGPQLEFETIQPQFLKKQFIAIGRFTDKKAPYYTIMAFQEVAKKYPDAQLLMAGDGPLLNMCQNLVRHYGLESQVTFLGVISPATFRDLLQESLALVQHSIVAASGDMEGTPLAILEASMAGLPVIATNHAGIPDVVIHEHTGLLSDEHDIKQMGLHMQRLLGDVSFAKTLGDNGKKHISEHFNLKGHIAKLQDILKEAV